MGLYLFLNDYQLGIPSIRGLLLYAHFTMFCFNESLLPQFLFTLFHFSFFYVNSWVIRMIYHILFITPLVELCASTQLHIELSNSVELRKVGVSPVLLVSVLNHFLLRFYTWANMAQGKRFWCSYRFGRHIFSILR